MVKCKWLLPLTAFTYKTVAVEIFRSPTCRQALSKTSNCMPLLYTSCKEYSAFHLYLKLNGEFLLTFSIHFWSLDCGGRSEIYRRQWFPLEYYKVDD